MIFFKSVALPLKSKQAIVVLARLTENLLSHFVNSPFPLDILGRAKTSPPSLVRNGLAGLHLRHGTGR